MSGVSLLKQHPYLLEPQQNELEAVHNHTGVITAQGTPQGMQNFLLEAKHFLLLAQAAPAILQVPAVLL